MRCVLLSASRASLAKGWTLKFRTLFGAQSSLLTFPPLTQGLKLMLDILRLQPVAALHLTPPLHSWSNSPQHYAAVIAASVEIINQCCELGILWSISGPAATKLWPPVLLQTVLDAGARQTLLDLCMFGAGWKLPTAIFSSYSSLRALGVSCSNDHSHGARFQTKVSLPPSFLRCLCRVSAEAAF